MATRRNRKNGRFTKTTRRTSRKRAFNVSKAVETYIIANAGVRAFTGTNLPTFLTGKDVMNGFNNGANNSWELTLPELANLAMGGSGGIAQSYQDGLQGALRKNIKDNGVNAVMTAVLTPIAFNVGRKVLSKPIIRPANRMLKSIGVKEVKL